MRQLKILIRPKVWRWTYEYFVLTGSETAWLSLDSLSNIYMYQTYLTVSSSRTVEHYLAACPSE